MTRAALAMLLLCAPLAATAGSYNLFASADSGYGRSDATVGGQTLSSPAWDFGGQLALNATPFRPDLFQIGGAASYRQFHLGAGEGATRTDALGYSGTVSLLRSFPVSLSAFASRAQTDFSTSATAQQTGTSLVTTQGGTATFKLEQSPTVRATAQRTDIDNRDVGGLRTNGRSTLLGAGVSHQLENHDFSSNYDTSWNSGTYADTNYRTHHFTFFGNSNVSQELQVRVNEQYYLRSPTALAPGSPRIDDNSFSTQATWRPGGRLTSSAGYGYQHTVADFRGLGETREALGHNLSLGADWAQDERWSYFGNLSGGFNENRLGEGTARSSGGAAGGGARWTSRTGAGTWLLTGGGSLGLSEAQEEVPAEIDPATGAPSLGPATTRTRLVGAYGASASAGWNGTIGAWSAGLSYSGGYDSNLNGKVGWTLRNVATATAETRLLSGLSLRSQLQLSDNRQRVPIFGVGSAQTLIGSAGLAYRQHSADLSVGLTNAAAQGLTSPTGNQIVPASLNTVTRFVTLTAGTLLLRDLSLSGFARYLSVTAPDRTDTAEAAFNLRLTYRLGLFDLSAEDRYSVGTSIGPTVKTNAFFLRISRGFGLYI